jgi:3-dehydroquinate synthetase
LNQLVRQSMAVKLKVIEVDPYEKGLRQALNLGHSIGHGVEQASHFSISHGEAVAIGTVAEARLAEKIGLGQMGLPDRIASVLANLGLPTETPQDIPLDQIIQAMQHDKKRVAGQLRFALPVKIGEVRTGVIVEGWQQHFESQIKGG